MPDDPSAVHGKPSHPHASALGAAMRRANEYADAGGIPTEAVRRWVSPDLLLREAESTTQARHGEAPLDRHLRALGSSAYVFGFTVGRLFKEPETVLKPSPEERATTSADAAAANPFVKPGHAPAPPPPAAKSKEQQLADLAAEFGSVPLLHAARSALASRFSEARDLASWEDLVARDVDPESLRYASTQAAYRINGIETLGDVSRVVGLPGGRERMQEAVGMFIDGFLLAMHLPDAPGA